MDEQTIRYIAFVVAACILIWGVAELNKRLNHHKKIDPKSPNTWIKLDATRPDTAENVLPVVELDNQEKTHGPDIHVRAQQNGHHSESEKIS